MSEYNLEFVIKVPFKINTDFFLFRQFKSLVCKFEKMATKKSMGRIINYYN